MVLPQDLWWSWESLSVENGVWGGKPPQPPTLAHTLLISDAAVLRAGSEKEAAQAFSKARSGMSEPCVDFSISWCGNRGSERLVTCLKPHSFSKCTRCGWRALV